MSPSGDSEQESKGRKEVVMSQASGQATADAEVRERKERERDRQAQQTAHVKEHQLENHGTLTDLEWSEEPLFGTDKYRRAVPIFRPEQLKA